MYADCHIHAVFDGVDWKNAIARHQPKPDLPWLRNMLKKYQDLGVTYLRDGGDRWGVSKAARELAAEYGITYRTPLAPLCKTGHYGAFIGEKFENTRHFAELVANQRVLGADFIKIMISGLYDFNTFGVLTEAPLPPEEVRELVHIAKEEGMAVMAHANGARCMENAAAAGVDSIEHGAYPDKDALAAMADCGTIWVPTLSTVANLRGTGRHPETELAKILDFALQAVADYSGLIAPGTDAGAFAVPHGTETELPLLYSAGITPQRIDQGIAAIMKKF